MKKQSQLDSVSHKTIMWLIYMRTILELAIEYKNVNGSNQVQSHKLSPTAWGIYCRIVMLEDAIQSKSEKLRIKYLEALEMSKPVWKKSLDMTGSDYSIYIEPIIGTLYSKHKRGLNSIGLGYAPFGRLYDLYFNKHECDLEVESNKPVDIIVKETEKVLFDFKKEQKREKEVA